MGPYGKVLPNNGATIIKNMQGHRKIAKIKVCD